MIGVDEHAYSDYALVWLLHKMVDDGDEVVCVRVVENPFRPVEKNYQEEAKRLLGAIQAKNELNKAISIILEYSVGKLHDTFQQLVRSHSLRGGSVVCRTDAVSHTGWDLQSVHARGRHQGTNSWRAPGPDEHAKLILQILPPVQPHPSCRGQTGRQATQEEDEAHTGSGPAELCRHARLQRR